MKRYSIFAACLLLTACGRPATEQPGAAVAATNAAPAVVAPVDLSGLHEPFRAVVQNYLLIQQKLVADSVDGVPAAAAAIKQAVEADPGKTFGPDFSRELDQLAAAPDLHATRLAFAPLSETLIDVLAKNHIRTGVLHSAFCPMIKAYWLQPGAAIQNPYMGSQMPDCGSFRDQY
jgi:hypothetical protein